MNLKLKNKNILVTGGAGFLGVFVVENLKRRGCKNIFVPLSKDYDLLRTENIKKLYKDSRPDVVIHLAAKSGGIGLNRQRPGELFYKNMIMGIEVMEQARISGVEKFVGIGSVCSYPKITPLPFSEKNLWDGYPEETNAPYGLAKKMLLVQAQAYRRQYGFNAITLLPVNLYGPGDNFDAESSHVIPALIRKSIDAMEYIKRFRKPKKAVLEAWGTGRPTREFLYVEDCAKAIILAAEKYNKPEPVNIGTGVEISVKELVGSITKITGFKGKVGWDKTKPDGQPRRVVDVSRAKIEFGFSAETDLKTGLRKTIEWYKSEGLLRKIDPDKNFAS